MREDLLRVSESESLVVVCACACVHICLMCVNIMPIYNQPS